MAATTQVRLLVRTCLALLAAAKTVVVVLMVVVEVVATQDHHTTSVSVVTAEVENIAKFCQKALKMAFRPKIASEVSRSS